MKFNGLCALFIPAFFVVACSGGSDGTSSGSGSSSGQSSGSPSGSPSGSGTARSSEQTAPDDDTAPPKATAPTGKACSGADDCAYWYCRCNDGALVNSRQCYNGSCQGPKAHCESACNGFKHGGWSGNAGGGDDSASDPPAKKDPPSAGSCKTNNDCASFQCGCTNGSRISVRDCYGGVCNEAFGGCQSACSDSGRGDWDGT